MKGTAYILAVVLFLCAAPIFAQGAFVDVPTDHWAYDAVNQLQRHGIIIGYPDGTFGGRRAMTRYEFAVAIARLLPLIEQPVQTPTPTTTPGNYVTNEELNKALQDYVRKNELPDFTKFATKADLDAIRKLVDEFRDELAALGVDVDALKRDVAALCARVEALEAEARRVRFTGNVNAFAITGSADDGTPVDLDERTIPGDSTLLRDIAVVYDFDLNIVGRVSSAVTANASIDYGNYLNYVRWVDDYIDGRIPVNKGDVQGYAGGVETTNFVDTFFPYYLYIDAALGNGTMTVGRFPIQWTPYTLKKIDVDSYSSILKTDDGNYPMDGAKLAYNFGGVNLALFAAKNDQNDYLANGLTSQSNAGLYYDAIYDSADPHTPVFAPFNAAGGHAVGGLTGIITQTAGGRIGFGTPWKGNLGLNFYQAWSRDDYLALSPYDQARVFGADLTIPFCGFGFCGSWTECDTLATSGSGAADIDSDNTAWDAKITAGVGKLSLGAGYKRIESNFAAAGFWDKLGRWTNPTDVKGPYLDINYPISSRFNLILNGEWLTAIDTIGPLTADDDIIKAEGGLRWGISQANAMTLGVQWVQYNPTTAGVDEGNESYVTVGWAHQLNPNAAFKVGYQFINWDGGADQIIYGPDYRGSRGVVQFGVTF